MNANDCCPVSELINGSVFETNGDTMMKLMNPDIPTGGRLASYPVWAADLGNGQIKKLNRRTIVTVICNCCYDMVLKVSTN